MSRFIIDKNNNGKLYLNPLTVSLSFDLCSSSRGERQLKWEKGKTLKGSPKAAGCFVVVLQ